METPITIATRRIPPRIPQPIFFPISRPFTACLFSQLLSLDTPAYRIPYHRSRVFGRGAIPSAAASKPSPPQPQRVRNHRYRTERHRRAGDHRAQYQTEKRIQNTGCDRYADGVVDEREKQVLAYVAHGRLAKPAGARHAPQITADECHS